MTIRPYETSPSIRGIRIRLLSRKVQFALDLIVLVAAFYVAYNLRFDFSVPGAELRRMLLQAPLVVTVQFGTLIILGVYLFIWRYVGMAEMPKFAAAGVVSCLPLLAIRLGLPQQFRDLQVPLSVILMDTVLAFGGVLGLRVLRRTVYEWSRKRRSLVHRTSGERKPILLIGAGRAGFLAAGEIQSRGDSDLEIKGFLDDDPGKHGSIIQGIRVLGSIDRLPQLVADLGIDHVVISIAQGSRSEFLRILDVCKQIPIKVRVVPDLHEILHGNVQVSRIRDLRIEDLLGREPVNLDEAEIQDFLAGKTVMVTGAGGSIGSELARQVARFQPAKLLLVERAECALFDINRELEGNSPELVRVPLVADVGDDSRMRHIFGTYAPQVVLHSAAHKHLPMMEHNPTEALKNNVLATHALGRLAGEFGVEVFVLMSTDKAVRPTSVMGASKRTAELVVQSLDRAYETRFVAVRFGNVIGSAGSVVPIFREQILSGGPVTVTHPEMTRYFMTIPEAAQLVLQAGAMGEGGEIFVLDMGEPVRILDLAKEAILLSGLRPFVDINIEFTGVRPGEKLFEELQITEEAMSKTRHPKIFIGKIAAYPSQEVAVALKRIEFLAQYGHERDIRHYLSALLPEADLSRTSDLVSVPKRFAGVGGERAAAALP
jgi:FlaA1/EpsC-like NDP-sugar epimerase